MYPFQIESQFYYIEQKRQSLRYRHDSGDQK